MEAIASQAPHPYQKSPLLPYGLLMRFSSRQEANTWTPLRGFPPAHAPGAKAANGNHHADNDSQARYASLKPLTFQERIALERQCQE